MESKKNCGGMWEKVAKNGSIYLSGSIEIEGKRHNIVMFRNTHKAEGSNQPDWKIYPAQLKKQDVETEEKPF